MAESEEELKSLLMKVKEWKSWLKAQHSENKDHGIRSHHFIANRWGNNGNSGRLFSRAPKSLQMAAAALKLKDAPWKKSYDKPRQHIKSRDVTLPTKIRLVKAMVFPGVMYRCVSWTIKKAECQRTDASELWCWRRLLDCKIKPVNPKGNQSWIFFGRTDSEAETPILQPPDEKNWLIWKDPDAGKDWRQEKGMTEDEMVGWY